MRHKAVLILIMISLVLSASSWGFAKGGSKLETTDKELIVIETNRGKMIMALFPNAAPKHVAQFKELTKKGFFNGVRFHRIIPGFMIQAGDPLTRDLSKKPYWGTGGSGKNIPAEFNKLNHTIGRVGAARSQDPNSASSQFYICVGDATFLDNNYTVFGEIVEGMNVAIEISKLPRDGRDVPNKDVIIEKMLLVPNTLKPAK